MSARLFRWTLLVGTALGLAAGCSSSFTPKNEVNGIRILATRADQPYAKPGETVHLTALPVDGRASPVDPMRFFWFPAPCVNPPFGQYYACYPAFEALFPTGIDLTSALVEKTELDITIPANALDTAVVQPGQGERYATAFVFMVACPGHVERVARRSGLAPNAMPIGCFDARGQQLAEDQFVFGFTRVFVFADRRNAIPALNGVTFEGKPVDPAVGITTDRCTKPGDKQTCEKTVKLDVLFDDASAELDPDNIAENGKPSRETLYVDWFTSLGKLATDRKILFDGNLGRLPKTAIDYDPPTTPGKGKVWAVLHDNRGGTTWLEIPLEVR